MQPMYSLQTFLLWFLRFAKSRIGNPTKLGNDTNRTFAPSNRPQNGKNFHWVLKKFLWGIRFFVGIEFYGWVKEFDWVLL